MPPHLRTCGLPLCIGEGVRLERIDFASVARPYGSLPPPLPVPFGIQRRVGGRGPGEEGTRDVKPVRVRVCWQPHAGTGPWRCGSRDGDDARWSSPKPFLLMLLRAALRDEDWTVPVQPDTARLLEGHVMLVQADQVGDREPRLRDQIFAPTALVVLVQHDIDAVRVPATLLDSHGGRYSVELPAKIIQYGHTKVHFYLRDLWWAVSGGSGEARRHRPRSSSDMGGEALPEGRPSDRSPPSSRRRLGSTDLLPASGTLESCDDVAPVEG